jgi:ATP-binding cassette subfamily B protein
MRFKMGYFDKTPVGTLVTRTVSDVETIADIFSEGLLVIFGDFFKIAVLLAALFWAFDPTLVVISLSVIPILFIATRWFQRSIKESFTDVRNQVAALNAFVQERITGMALVHLFGREAAESARFEAINAKHRGANIRSIWSFSLFLPIIELLSAVSIGLAVWYGGYKAAAQAGVTVGDLTAMILFINMLYRPLRQLADRFNTLQMGMVASERVLKLIHATEEVEQNGTYQGPLRGVVEFQNVVFGYRPEEPVLKGFNLQIREGETLAVVGPTGAGKSTLIGLLLGHYLPQSGQILIDGVPLESWDKLALRSQAALVMQDVFLFSGTVRDNVTLFEPMDDERIWSAAEAMGLADFLRTLPGGLDFQVQERGSTLSTGQRQLLSFLRAFLLDPPVLVLDEATSNIDSETERWVQKATETLTKGRTSIVVAHRLATISHADRIAVIADGGLAECGTHEELIALGGRYATLVKSSFTGEH